MKKSLIAVFFGMVATGASAFTPCTQPEAAWCDSQCGLAEGVCYSLAICVQHTPQGACSRFVVNLTCDCRGISLPGPGGIGPGVPDPEGPRYQSVRPGEINCVGELGFNEDGTTFCVEPEVQ